MRDLLRAIARRLVQNAHFKVLAVVVAVGAWWYVQASDVDTRHLRVGVEWLPPRDLVTTEPLPASVLVTVAGSRNALRRIDEQSLSLSVDLAVAGSTVGEHSLDLSPPDVRGLPPTAAAVEIRPPTITFTLDEVDTRRVPVQLTLVGQPAEGWFVQQVEVEPTAIELRGPRVALAGLLGVETEPIDLSELKHDRKLTARLAPPRAVEVRGPPFVEVRIDVEARVDARTFIDVPVYVRGLSGWVVNPPTVRIQAEGPAAALRQIRDRDVVSQVYLPDDVAKGRYRVRFDAREGPRAEVVLPAEGVRVVQVDPIEIEVVVP
jgi:hypothetical protein